MSEPEKTYSFIPFTVNLFIRGKATAIVTRYGFCTGDMVADDVRGSVLRRELPSTASMLETILEDHNEKTLTASEAELLLTNIASDIWTSIKQNNDYWRRCRDKTLWGRIRWMFSHENPKVPLIPSVAGLAMGDGFAMRYDLNDVIAVQVNLDCENMR